MSITKGFTLLELLVVIAIIGILSAIGVPMYSGYVESVREKDAQNTLSSIFLMQKDFFSQNYCYFVTGTGDKATEINSGLFGSAESSSGPIPTSGNLYTFQITGTTSSACSAAGRASTYTATATSSGKTFSIDSDFIKTNF
jgi:type IV pilus assembly protein PilE